jgi:hypothetical protein
MTPNTQRRSQGLLVIRNRPKPSDTINVLRIRRWIWNGIALLRNSRLGHWSESDEVADLFCLFLHAA